MRILYTPIYIVICHHRFLFVYSMRILTTVIQYYNNMRRGDVAKLWGNRRG